MAKGKNEDILKAIEEMSVLELSELVESLEEKFGVTAAAPVAVAAPAAAGAAPAGEAGEEAEEQTIFNVVIADAGANKLGVIKTLRELVPTLGLKEAKDLVDAAPKEVMMQVNKKTADEAKEKLTAAGATVELK
jgi:large subunit ribosomal protein L7/L12